MKIPIYKYLYNYRGIVRDVFDGDTFRADVFLGLGTIREWTDISFRLSVVDTPELHGVESEDGIFVRDYVRSIILDKRVIIATEKKTSRGRWSEIDKTGSRGRWLAWVFMEDSDVLNENESLNEHLLRNGLASFWGEPWAGLPEN